jgi:dTDP-4-dehydrorhamnose reductase
VKIALLGSSGMLGQMVARYFGPRHDVLRFDARYSYSTRKSFLEGLQKIEADVVINCIGLIKQKSDNAADLYELNGILPFDIVRSISPESLYIHPSTDCVFDAQAASPYAKQHTPNASDDYGWSKALGEFAVSSGSGIQCVVRVSIVGPDARVDARGLMAWFLSQPTGSRVTGYSNHFWNGITTLEWCKRVEQLLVNPFQAGDRRLPRMIQLGMAREYSKLEVLQHFNIAFERRIHIEPGLHGMRQYRCLSPDCESPELAAQLVEIRDYV